MQPTASIPFGHMADLELGSDVWSQAVVLGKLGTSILIYMDNTRVSFLDDLIKTCSWNILYFIPYTLMIKFTTCFPMVGGCPGTLASSTTKTGRHDMLKLSWLLAKWYDQLPWWLVHNIFVTCMTLLHDMFICTSDSWH